MIALAVVFWRRAARCCVVVALATTADALHSSVLAQAVPVVLVPGLREASYTYSWDLLASSLASLNVDVIRAPLNTEVSYSLQGAELHQYLVGRGVSPAEAIAVGHSNGGLVSREAARAFSLRGIVTFGTPHSGVPLIWAIPSAFYFADGALSAFNDLSFLTLELALNCYGPVYCEDWTWNILSMAYLVVDYLIIPASLTDALLDFLPSSALLTQATPGSQYLTSLNSPSNLAAEAALVRNRAGLVVTTQDYYVGGFLRLYNNPFNANALAYDVAYAGGMAYSAHNQAAAAADSMLQNWFYWGEIDWNRYYALLDLSGALFNTAIFLLGHEGAWCQFVNGGGCGPSDSFIPTSAQQYPGAQFNTSVTASWAHTFQYWDPVVVPAIKDRAAAMLQVP